MKLKFVAFNEAILCPMAGNISSQKTLGTDRPGQLDIIMVYPHKEYPGCVVIKSHHEIVPIPLSNVKSMVVDQEAVIDDKH